mgnify:CR=1 FL=1
MKKLTKAIIAGGLLASAATAQAEGLEVSGNVALTTDYIWRGVSQTDSSPAIQGGFDIECESGLYAGIWGSNIDFGSGDDSNMEVDYYFGFSRDINDNLSYDIGYVWYDYPQEGGNNFGELYASLSFMDATVGVYHQDDTVSPYANTAGDTNAPQQYYYVDYSREVANGISVGAHVGHYNLVGAGAEDYSDWNVSVSKTVAGVDLSLMYSATNLNDGASHQMDDSADDVFVFTIAKSL